MAKVQFTVYGEAKGKARPRFSRVSGHTYTPKDTLYYESHVMNSFKEACPDWKPSDKALMAYVNVYTQIPKSTSKKKKILMLKHLLHPTKKPDADNIMKAIFDSLNGIAYVDDCQIISIAYNKMFDEQPRVEVTLTELED